LKNLDGGEEEEEEDEEEDEEEEDEEEDGVEVDVRAEVLIERGAFALGVSEVSGLLDCDASCLEVSSVRVAAASDLEEGLGPSLLCVDDAA
jgi:hypothetical protein